MTEESRIIVHGDATCRPISDFPYLSFDFKEFNPIQSRFLELLGKKRNTIVACPTNAGKTVIAEISMADFLRRHPDRKVVYASPMKALTEEKYDRWQEVEEFHPVEILTGDHQASEAKLRKIREAKLILLTTEMVDSRSKKSDIDSGSWMRDVGLIVEDEFHLIGTPGRGDIAEAGIMTHSAVVPEARYVLLSATVPNAVEVAEWLARITGKKTNVIISEYRPVPLDTHILTFRDAKMKPAAVLQVAKTKIAKDEQFLVFVHTKSDGRAISEILDRAGYKNRFHNAELNRDDRAFIEDKFRRRKLQAVVATSTLAMGVNLPARHVIIAGTRRGIEKVTKIELHQMAGRAGRSGLDTKGDAWVLTQNREDIDPWEKIENLKSKMRDLNILAFHVLAEIFSGRIRKIEDFDPWYSRSLAYHQGIRYEAVELLFGKLEQMKMVEKKGDVYELTWLGKQCVYLYLSPFDVWDWWRNFWRIHDRGMWDDPDCLIWALTDLKMFAFGWVPPIIKDEVDAFVRRATSKGAYFKHDGVVGGMIADICGEREADDPKPSGYAFQIVHPLKNDIERIAGLLGMMNAKGRWDKAGHLARLTAMVKYLTPWNISELVLLPSIGATRAKKLFDAGIRGLEDFRSHEKLVRSVIGNKITNKAMEGFEKAQDLLGMEAF